ncbi:MAG: efflux transporter outer membrane subunit [Flavobacteriales bacterium]|nr:efflux transporter outer membrane subunit [Flavobacteriales bacterium]MCB9363537.1 efflux transporter outer membrane subunit [Flavobacteriales bacterium]
MYKKITYILMGVFFISLTFSACKTPSSLSRTENTTVPANYNNSQDTTNSATIKWQDYFTDTYLIALIDTALKNNQELNITMQEIEISRNEIRAKRGEYLPSIGIGAGAEVEKVGEFTRNGAVEKNLEIKHGEEFPEPLPDFMIGAYAKWEIDIWKKLRNGKKAAVSRYLSSVEGKNFMVTNLIAEISNSYYELLALDNELSIVEQNVKIQSDALKVVRLQKMAAEVNELAVKRFEAQLLNTKALQYGIKQEIVETENKINFLVGRFPQPVERNVQSFNSIIPNSVYAGIPTQLLDNRPDIKQAEMELAAAKLDVKVAKARFYPSVGISAGVGLQAFNPEYLLETPASMIYSLVGDIAAPLINRSAIKASYNSASAKQLQAVFNYERTILNAYIEIVNQLSNIDNLKMSYDLKKQEVETLSTSITIANNLFKSAKADYMEVLLTQRESLESKFELVETKKQQMNAMVNVYQALGGGWK